MVRAVTFDLWNILLSEGTHVAMRTRCLAEVLREYGIGQDHDEIWEAYASAQEYVHRV